jgi:DNA-3-methyladenine glycosylase II
MKMALLGMPQPFDFELSTARYHRWGRDLANLWEDGALWRVVGGREVRIAANGDGVDVEPLDAGTGAVVQKLLGAEFDLDAFAAFAATEPVLARIVPGLRGLRPPLAPDPFEALVTSITAQQVSLHAAFAIRSRFVERFGVRAGRAWSFPARERVAGAEEPELVALGFSRRKAEYVVGLARSDLDLDALAVLPDDEVKARLVALRGIGEWTAEWFLARHLARPRAWPVGDVGLRNAVVHFYGDADERAARPRFEPFENLSAHYLLGALYAGVGA